MSFPGPDHHAEDGANASPPIEADGATREGMGERRSMALAVILSVGAAAVLFLIAASLLTIPLFALARFTEPGKGTGREWFREGLRWAIFGGAAVAVASGVALGWWLRRGGKLPTPTKPWEIE